MQGVGVDEMASAARRLAILTGLLLLHAKISMGLESGSAAESCSGSEPTFEGWQQWALITPEPVRSKGHSYNRVGFYTDELAESTYRSASSPYPVCAKTAKPIYTDSIGKQIRKLTVMVKMPPGYDPENAGWWYGVYDPSGSRMKLQGKLTDCIPCHKQAAETDYLFAEEVTNASGE